MENNLWLRKRKKFQRSGPDGLEAWGVAIAASIINFIMAGINRASGILYVEFLDAFQVDRMQASLPFTIRSVSRNLLGPVVGIFGQKYGVRPVILVGGVLGSLSTIACFFVADIFWISVFWGCFNGIGTAMIITLTQAAIGEHFVKHISTASGIGLSGGCFGSFVFPVMFEKLIEKYSIQGTFLFIAGLIMHVIPAAIIMKKPTWLKNKPIKVKENLVNGNVIPYCTTTDTKCTIPNRSKSEDSESLLQEDCETNGEITSHNKENKILSLNDLSENVSNKINTDFLWLKREVLIRMLTNNNVQNFPPPEVWQSENICPDMQIKEIINLFWKISNDAYNQSSKVESSNHCNAGKLDENIYSEDDKVMFSNGHLQLTETTEFNSNPVDCLHDILEKFFERDKYNAVLSKSQGKSEDECEIVNALFQIYVLLERKKCNSFSNPQQVTNIVNSFQESGEPSNTFYSHIKTAVWLHAKPLFLLTCLCRCVHFITFQPILTTVVDFSRDKGLPAEYGIYAIGTLALGDLFGRLFSGWLTDKNCLTLPRYMFIFMVLQGMFTMAIALTNSAESLLPILTIYGLLQGSTFIQHPVLVSHYMGKDEQSIAIGCLNFFPGIIGFAMPFYIGYFRDTVGSYDGMFYINGSIGCFIGLLWLTEPYLRKCSLKLPQRNQQIQV